MTQQSHFWAYTPRKPDLKEIRAPQCSLWCFFFSRYIPRSVIARSHGSSSFSFLRKLHSHCINLHSHQPCTKIPFYPHHLQQLLFVDFLMISIQTCTGTVRRYCTYFWSSLEKCLLRILPISIKLFGGFWYWVVWAVFKFWILIYCHTIICEYLLPFCRLSCCFVDGFLCCVKAFVPFVYFCF